MRLDFSVVIPTCNRAPLLRETLATIVEQTHPPAEVIVVDDGSIDDTEAVVGSLAYPVKYVRIENQGPWHARNIGASLASAPWIAFCDSDDLWHPDKLANQARLLRAAPDVHFAFTNFRTISHGVWSTGTKFDDAPPDFWSLPKRQLESDSFLISAPIFVELLTFQPIFPSTVIVSQDFFRRIGGWPEAMGRVLSGDLEFFLRCVIEPPVGVLTAPLVGIRKHAGNRSGHYLDTIQGQIQVLQYVLARHPFAARYQREVRGSISERATTGAEMAFDEGHLDLVRRLLANVPLRRRSWKLHLKAAIADLPGPAARVLRKVVKRRWRPAEPPR